MYNMDAPVVIGPLDGNMSFPPAFCARESRAALLFTAVGRRASHLMNWLVPGKLRADVLLVSNQRTRDGLPRGVRGRVIEFCENGVELDIWRPAAHPPSAGRPVRFTYAGRLVDWKAVDVFIRAFSRIATQIDAELQIIGDGPKRQELVALAATLNVSHRIQFTGWLPQTEMAERLSASDVFVLPSIYECGGAVVLEAMAVGIPVIATAWGGPCDYVDSTCGILVEPSSEEDLIDGFAGARVRLAHSPQIRAQMGASGRKRAETHFCWNAKVDLLMNIFSSLIDIPLPRMTPVQYDVSLGISAETGRQ